MHTDFRINEKLKLQRRLNVIVYLNDDWNPEWGGALVLKDPSQKIREEIFPDNNKMLIMETTDTSFHGHPDPLNVPDNTTRRSLALYYYTASEHIMVEVPNLNTIYAATEDSGLKDRARLFVNNLAQFMLFELTPPLLYRLYRRFRPL